MHEGFIEEASDAFRRFVARALVKEPSHRPSCEQLLGDSFVSAATRDGLVAVLDGLADRGNAPATDAPPQNQAEANGETILV